MREFLNTLKLRAQENPEWALLAGATVFTAITKFIGASVSHRNSRAWAKEVRRRERKDQEN